MKIPMNTLIKTAVLLATLGAAAHACAQVTLYEHDSYGGRSFSTQRAINNFDRSGFNDRASSVVVTRDRWEVCENAGFAGRCVVLRQGSYPSLAAMGLNDRVSSVRQIGANARVDNGRYAPLPVVTQDYRRRGSERLFQANVVAVRAVMGTPEQRCWMEREEVPAERGRANVPGAIAGAVIGGILGHQIGGGSGRDIARAGGVVAGAAVGANVGRNGQPASSRDVQRCEPVASANTAPQYWDVTYNFRGQEHNVQMTSPPGATVTVNRQGEPRVPA